MPSSDQRIEFLGSQNAMLAARLDLPSGAPRAFAVFAHCFTCTKDVFAASRICAELAEHGIAVLRFDFTGLGASEGDFANTNFTSNVDDLIAAADWLAEHHQAPKLLIGHSLGGAAVLAAAGRIASAKAVATIGAPADTDHLKRLFTGSEAEIAEKGEAEVRLIGRPFRIRKQFIDDIETYRLRNDISVLHKALIVFHAPGDVTVGIENAAQIFGAAKHPKSFISLDGADHLLTRREDALYVAQLLSAWVARYL